jgi:hypothetical protein
LSLVVLGFERALCSLGKHLNYKIFPTHKIYKTRDVWLSGRVFTWHIQGPEFNLMYQTKDKEKKKNIHVYASQKNENTDL